MIAQLSGKLIAKQPNSIILDVHGVGYEVTIPITTFYGLGEMGSEVSLKIHTHVREDSLQLFGFASLRDKELFLKLLSVSGIGPKVAITMLSGMASAELITAITKNDLGRLTAIPGVGKKTAERVVVELRDKLGKMVFEEGEMTVSVQTALSDMAIKEDTVEALIALGYPKPVAERAVNAALSEDGDTTIQAVLKRSLKRLSR
ncbi:MAG: Holliday junction branch migration protein RuvA [Acidobacteria bacterium]|nr:Holliday junction branch migration protein RuvA [Acidobacteriota bacterium]